MERNLNVMKSNLLTASIRLSSDTFTLSNASRQLFRNPSSGELKGNAMETCFSFCSFSSEQEAANPKHHQGHSFHPGHSGVTHGAQGWRYRAIWNLEDGRTLCEVLRSLRTCP